MLSHDHKQANKSCANCPLCYWILWSGHSGFWMLSLYLDNLSVSIGNDCFCGRFLAILHTHKRHYLTLISLNQTDCLGKNENIYMIRELWFPSIFWCFTSTQLMCVIGINCMYFIHSNGYILSVHFKSVLFWYTSLEHSGLPLFSC